MKKYLFLIKKTWGNHLDHTNIAQVIAENMDEAIARAYDLSVPKFTAWTFGNLPFGKIDGIWVEEYKKDYHYEKVLTGFEKNIDYPKKFWGRIIIWAILYFSLSAIWIFQPIINK